MATMISGSSVTGESIFSSETVTVQLAVPPPHLGTVGRNIGDVHALCHGRVRQYITHEHNALTAVAGEYGTGIHH